MSTQPVRFEDIGGTIAFDQRNSSAGIALVDFDDDGWPDLTTLGERGVYQFRNLGDGTFAPVQGGGPDGPVVDAPNGLAYGDIDGDSDLDLYVATFTSDRLYRQEADGHFVDVTQAAGIAGTAMKHSPTFTDIDNDGDLDVLVAVEDREDGPEDDDEVVWRNRGDGTFESVARAVGLSGTPHSVTYQMVAFDMTGDHYVDVFVAHDFIPDQVYINRGDGTFTDESASWLPSDKTGLMGVDVADMDGDGKLDMWGTNYNGDRFYRRDDFGTTLFMPYLELALGGGFNPSLDLTGWGVTLSDVDDDGEPDVLTTASSNGEGKEDFSRPPRLMLLENHGFNAKPAMLVDISETAGPTFEMFLDAKSLAVGDVDRDGDVDVALGVVQSKDPPSWFLDDTVRRSVLLINTSARAAANRSLVVHLRQPGRGDPFAVSARVDVEVRGQRSSRVLLAGSSYASCHSYALHFGLGDAERANRVVVTWPDGGREEFTDVKAGEVDIVRSAGAPRYRVVPRR
ncbi:MAG: CRTAC1 family protein [Myxococcales bacterium]|nr:CRTAC1 family protein [Myxococcales bacterium]